jgi:agarase
VAFPPQAPGKQALVKFFKERYPTYERFSAVWRVSRKEWDSLASVTRLRERDRTKAQADREAFVLLVARQYFKTATDAIRAKDPNHLILGCRFVWILALKPAVQACGEYCDVVSLNYYEAGIAGKTLLWYTGSASMRVSTDLGFAPFYALAKKPLLVTEFSFRANDSGMPNSYPPGLLLQPNVRTQKVRADKFEECATTWMRQPYFLGYHWFDYMDEPKGGRFDGENGNYGLVNNNDDPYTVFVERLKQTNARVWDLHRAARSSGGH